METTPRRWDVAPLIVVGVALGLLGQLLAEFSAGSAGVLSLGGFALLLAGLVRWSRRNGRGALARTASSPRVTV